MENEQWDAWERVGSGFGVIFGLLLIVAEVQAHDAITATGQLLDPKTHEPVEGATVYFMDGEEEGRGEHQGHDGCEPPPEPASVWTCTHEDGFFNFEVPRTDHPDAGFRAKKGDWHVEMDGL